MKLRNLFLSLIAAGTLFACSSGDDPVTPENKVAVLSLMADIPATKALDSDIAELTVAVYRADGMYLTHKSSVAVETVSPDEVTEIEVPEGGSVRILVFANLGDTDIEGVSLDAAMALTTDLEKEADGNLTMSSQVYSALLSTAEHNYMGYTDGENGDGNYFETGVPVKLYRNVARVQLVSLTVRENTQYGTASSFVLDTLFLANVKGESQLASAGAWGTVEASAGENVTAFWRDGLYNDVTGSYKSNAGTLTPELAYGADPATGIITVNAGETYTQTDPIGKFFYTYENMTGGAGEQTLLVLRGSYTYTPLGESLPVTEKDRFYAVPVNNTGTSTVGEGTPTHTGIKRNVRYDIKASITGPGSTGPYTPAETVNLNAEVVVVDWNAPTTIEGNVE